MALPTVFTQGDIFTAANANLLRSNQFNQTTSTKVNSYTLIASDAGTKIVMNSASATTITVNTSLFAANDTLTIRNIGAGVCTVTAGTATVSSAGPLAIPQHGGGELYFTSAGVSTYSPTAVTAAAAASGLTFITSGSVTAQTGLTIPNVFSATYENYLCTLALTGNSAVTATQMNFGTSSTKDVGANYNDNLLFLSFISPSASATAGGALAATKFRVNSKPNTNGHTSINIYAPNLARNTSYASNYSSLLSTEIETVYAGGVVDTATQYTDLFFTATTGNFTFTFKLYGYQNS